MRTVDAVAVAGSGLPAMSPVAPHAARLGVGMAALRFSGGIAAARFGAGMSAAAQAARKALTARNVAAAPGPRTWSPPV